MTALDKLCKFRLDLARPELTDTPVLFNIGPFADQVEMVGIGVVTTQHAIFDLSASGGTDCCRRNQTC